MTVELKRGVEEIGCVLVDWGASMEMASGWFAKIEKKRERREKSGGLDWWI